MGGTGSERLVMMGKINLLVFPASALLNSFSMTALLLLFGLAGRAETAADIALVQGASLALFYAFSANARNLVLAGLGDFGLAAATSLLQVRLLLLAPLACATYVLAVGVGGATPSLALVLIMRRIAEWFGEIAIARHEMLGQPKRVISSVVAECTSLLLCLILSIGFAVDLSASATLWVLAPLMAVRGAGLSFGGGKIEIRTLWPHFGSTAIIGAGVYIFRISVTLLAGKAFAGMLFTAYAIGGLVPTIFSQALAPTLLRKYGSGRLPTIVKAVSAVIMCVGGVLAAVSIVSPEAFSATRLPAIFWLTTGISIAGGAIMMIAASLRASLIHSDNGREVFGPDLLANLLISTSVPFAFYAFGANSLAGLYLLSACLSLGFLWGAGENSRLEVRYRRPATFVLAGLLVFPVFFQIDGGLFRDPAFVFDAQGSILRLPLPISVMAVFLGIGILGNYAMASRTLTTLFFSALLLVMTSLVAAQGNAEQEGAKLILLAQYLLPMFGLVLGEMYGATTREPIFECTVLWVLLLVLPAQLLATWMQGYALLSPKVFFFSIYQHLQYFPMIVAALFTLVLVSLWDRPGEKRLHVGLLASIAAIYLIAAISVGAIAGLAIGLGTFAFFHLREPASRQSSVPTLCAVICSALLFGAFSVSGGLAKFVAPDGPQREQMSWTSKLPEMALSNTSSAPTGVQGHLAYWRFYAERIVESPRAFLVGHPMPRDRTKDPSGHNYWLDVAYNFGVTAMLPVLTMLLWTLRVLWKKRAAVAKDPLLLGVAMASGYLVLVESMIKVGMRQPYSGIITFFLWGLLIARLRIHPVATVRGEGVTA